MDCLSIPDGEYNCTNPWGVNCINTVGFDFDTMWKITMRIQQYCPIDARLFLKDNMPATEANAALTGKSCWDIAGSTWQQYPPSDIWARLTTWKFPLFQLVASSPRPPLGLAVEVFVILHLLGDPVGTIKDLLCTISSCQKRADFWRNYLPKLGGGLLDLAQIDHAWKSFTIITVSYGEWGMGDNVQGILTKSLDRILATEDATADLQTFLDLCNSTADALAADRSTNSLPIIAAQLLFAGSLAAAMAKTAANTSSTSLFINVEAHSIAFSALYFWILLAVSLSSVVGVSQTQNAIPRILRCFQDGFDHRLPNVGIILPNDDLGKGQLRVLNGGVYSWQPDRSDVNEANSLGALFQRNTLPLIVVIMGTVTAWLVSGFVPPKGWEQRLCAQAMILLTWLLSFCFTCLLKRNLKLPSYNKNGRFWLTFFKDVLATTATLGGGIMVTQSGIFNRCDSYTRWSRTGLALPNQPNTAAALAKGINIVYPATIFVSIGLQMVVIPVAILAGYRHAFLVFLQRDDENSSSLWFLEWRWLTRLTCSIPMHQRLHDSSNELHIRESSDNGRTPNEEVEMRPPAKATELLTDRDGHHQGSSQRYGSLE